MGFSLSPVNLGGLCGSTLLNIWVTQSITAEIHPEVSNGRGTRAAWRVGDVSESTERRRAGERIRVERHRCAFTFMVMCINHTLLTSVSGNSHLPYIIIIHSDCHLFSRCSPPPPWAFYPFIYEGVFSCSGYLDFELMHFISLTVPLQNVPNFM